MMLVTVLVDAARRHVDDRAALDAIGTGRAGGGGGLGGRPKWRRASDQSRQLPQLVRDMIIERQR